MDNKTKLFTNGVIWFGVAISVSEIEAGIQIGTQSALSSLWLPLILGHIIGAILLYFVGYIGSQVRLNAMQTTALTFGRYGSKFFASLNVLQLIAWVAVLNAQGALALSGLNLPIPFSMICIILAIMVAGWVYVGLKRSSKITTIVMTILTILLIILTFKLYLIEPTLNSSLAQNSTLGFWNIFEISIAMPISWLPVISDYTKDVEKPKLATMISSIAYTIASLWMYFIGVEIAAINTNNVAQAILLAGLGTTGIIIMVLSTVTTNFLATNSAGESAKAIYDKIDPKTAGLVVSALSAMLAISGIMDHYINFLYLISSVFAPMAAVQLVSYYFGKKEYASIGVNYWNIFSWFAGFIAYQIVSIQESVILGPTLLAIIVSAGLAFIYVKYKNNSTHQSLT